MTSRWEGVLLQQVYVVPRINLENPAGQNKINEEEMKNKGGRPSKPFAERRHYQLNISLTIDEQVLLKQKAREVGLPLTDFVRECIQRSVIKQRLTVEQISLLKQLGGIANNINQVAKKANIHGYESAKNEYLFLAEDIDKLIKQLLK